MTIEELIVMYIIVAVFALVGAYLAIRDLLYMRYIKELKNERAKTIEAYRTFCRLPGNNGCRKTDDECDGMCVDCFVKWIEEKNE